MTPQQKQYAEKHLKGLTGYEVYSKYKHLILGSTRNNKLFNHLMEAWREINNIKMKEKKYTIEPQRVRIGEPIWNNGDHKVGIAEDAMNSEIIRIEVMYEDKKGNRLYPNEFTISKAEAMKYPKQRLKSHTLRLIPISDLKEQKVSGELVNDIQDMWFNK